MNRPTTYTELKESIGQAYAQLPKQLQRIARFALDKPDELALGTVAVIAGAADVQPSSVIRFANALGFNGFSDRDVFLVGDTQSDVAAARAANAVAVAVATGGATIEDLAAGNPDHLLTSLEPAEAVLGAFARTDA